MADALADARTAFADRRWEDAYALFAEADTGDALDPGDLERFARTASLTGRDAEAEVLLDRGYGLCVAAGDELRAADCAFWLGFRLLSLGETGRGRAWIGRAESLVAGHGDCVQAGYLLLPRIHAALLAQRNLDALSLAREAAACGDRFGDRDLSALARQLGGRALVEEGRVGEGIALLDEAMLTASSAQAGEVVRGIVYCAVLGCCERVLAVDRAREWSAVLAEWCDAQDQLGRFDGTCRIHRAALFRLAGEWDAALGEARIVRSSRAADAYERGWAAYEQAEIHRLRGEPGPASAAYADATSEGVDPLPGSALLALAEGDAPAGAAAIRRALSTTRSPLGRVRLLAPAVELFTAAGDAEEARASADELASIAETFGTPALAASAAEARGRVLLADGDPAGAAAELGRAFAGWADLHALYESARIRVLLAECFEALGDDRGGAAQRDAAAAVFEDLGAAAAGRQTPGGVADVLSPRESGVLRLAATGITNKEIGVRLGISVRTVDRHISSILTKLGVPSRAAATAFAYEHGLLDARTG